MDYETKNDKYLVKIWALNLRRKNDKAIVIAFQMEPP